ncbi:MAG: 16S rRNA (uracil(1498)-N(3))-methyltransferase [Muribaculaceae bacterium]|nr:16S rRNA (uracil(1498)-N(3))-methyltransferase [Muribaculaceae bacterium]
MIRFYCPEIEENPLMPEVESGHCVRVLRHQPGDLFEVVDGKGWLYTVRLVDAHPKRAMVEIVERRELPSYWEGKLVLAVAPTKNMDRMEWLVEKATEVGMDGFVPLHCRFSERKEIKRERLEKTAVSAMKQSLKASLPEISEMTPFSRFIERYRDFTGKFIAHCVDDGQRRLLAREYRPGEDSVILIGPEGDFSQEEISMALEAGFRPVSLGNARLRTETAALTALETFHIAGQLKSSAD